MFSTTIPAFEEARNNYKTALNDFNVELNSRIQSFNEVVRNLAVKFNSDITPAHTIIQQFSIKITAEQFIRVGHNESLVFRASGSNSEVYIPVAFLRNDPIAAAIHVRKKIREMQKKHKDDELAKLTEELRKARHARATAEGKERALAERIEAYRNQSKPNKEVK